MARRSRSASSAEERKRNAKGDRQNQPERHTGSKWTASIADRVPETAEHEVKEHDHWRDHQEEEEASEIQRNGNTE